VPFVANVSIAKICAPISEMGGRAGDAVWSSHAMGHISCASTLR